MNVKLFEIKKNKTDIPSMVINGPQDCYNFVRNLFGDEMYVYESCYAVFVNRSNCTVGYTKLSQGGINATVIDNRMICKYAVDTLCSGVILVHNHPSGNPIPSKNDVEVTGALKNCLNMFDIFLMDHIIIAEKSYYSFNDEDVHVIE